MAISFGYNHIDAGSFFSYTSLALEHDMVAMSVPPFDAACPAGEQLPLVVTQSFVKGMMQILQKLF